MAPIPIIYISVASFSLTKFALIRDWIGIKLINCLDFCGQIDKDGMMGKLASGCNMVDLLRFDDSDHNGQLNINEFYTAFNKLYSKFPSAA